MKGNERLEVFLQLQNKNLSFDDISNEIGITSATLRRFLNKMGYKLNNGKYVYTIDVDSKIDIESSKKDDNSLKSKKKSKKETQITFEQVQEKNNSVNKTKKAATSKIKPKKDRKINITQDDLDKLCEVYDWYLEVKDYKSMKLKQTSKKKDIIVEDTELKDVKGTSIRVEKSTWEEFERLCSNSQFSKQQIITQALKDFMKEYKNLL